MPSIVRLGDIDSGHGCWPSRPNAGASENVIVNGLGAHRVGDPWQPHCCCSIPETHDSIQATGSPNVFINGQPAARVGDVIACGSTNATGSENVIAN